MAMFLDYVSGSKRPWNHDLGNDPAEVSKKSKIRSDVAPIERDMDEIKEVFQNTLDGISTPADRDWAFGGPLLHAANPGLTLPKSGIVGLPLSAYDVSRIQDESQESLSKVDNSTAEKLSCWTFSAEQFGIRNPGWNSFVKDFVRETFGRSLGYYQIDLLGLRLEGASATSSAPV